MRLNQEFKDILIGIKRAIGLLDKPERFQLTVATIIMLLAGLLTNLPAVILGKLVDQLTNVQQIQIGQVLPFIVLIIIIILVREGLTILRKYLIENIVTQTDKEQTVRLIDRLLKTDIGNFLYQQQIGSLHGRIFRSMQGLVRILKLTFLDFAPIFFSAIAAIGIALFQRPLVAFVMIMVIPSGLYLIIKQVSSQKGIRVALLRGKEKIDGKVVEMLGGIETIRVLNTVPFEVQKIEAIAEKQRQIEIKHHIYMAFFDAAKYLNEGFIYIVVIVLSIYLASLGIISRGDILVYSILFLSITSPLREIHRILDQAHESSIQVNDLYNLLHQPIDSSLVNEDSNPEKENSQTLTVLETEDLSFEYDKDHDQILKNISLKISQGEKVGLVGASGCGKTTFVHILLKLAHNYQGQVKLFDQSLLDIPRTELADRIAYVPQKPFIFSGTIQENIVYGCQENVSETRLIEAAKNAHIYDEVQDKLGGFNGKVTENGNNLSGGQRQRLAIARVMLQSPDLIIFDEATSALDNTNEAIIQKNIARIFKDKTIISIAHRLTTLKDYDRILVFDQGKIIQTGTFNQLSKQTGLFKDFLSQKTSI